MDSKTMTENIGPISLSDARVSMPETGLTRQVLAFSERMMLVRHVMERGWKSARHSHPHEQLVYVVRGHVRFTSGDRTFELAAGDSYIAPGGVEHEATALAESEVLDVFSPAREDYVENVHGI